MMIKTFKPAQLLAVFVALALLGGVGQAQEKGEKGEAGRPVGNADECVGERFVFGAGGPAAGEGKAKNAVGGAAVHPLD